MKEQITKAKFIEILECSIDGFVAPEWDCFSGYDRVGVIEVGFELVKEGLLQVRSCSALAFESTQ